MLMTSCDETFVFSQKLIGFPECREMSEADLIFNWWNNYSQSRIDNSRQVVGNPPSAEEKTEILFANQ